MADWDPSALIVQYQQMNRAKWDLLAKRGIAPPTEATLSFSYAAERPSDAERLARFLESETDYQVEAAEDAVTGSTQARPVTIELLNDWLEWMIRAGFDHGRCRFHGWGTQGSFHELL